jgi:hypothetical protein
VVALGGNRSMADMTGLMEDMVDEPTGSALRFN